MLQERPSSRKRHRVYDELLDRDGPSCYYCSVYFEPSITKRRMTIDHVVPRSHGGSSLSYNLVLACLACNSRKGDMSADDYMDTQIARDRRTTILSHAFRHHHEAILFTKNGNWSCLCGAHGKSSDDPKIIKCTLTKYGIFYRPPK